MDSAGEDPIPRDDWFTSPGEEKAEAAATSCDLVPTANEFVPGREKRTHGQQDTPNG